MLRKEINDLLTQTGGSTPMGSMFRQYWIPALLASELPKDDCPPVRVKLLSERLIAFRDSKGRYGLMDEFCAHRGVCHYGLAGTKKAGYAAPIMVGNTTIQVNVSRSRQNPKNQVFVRRLNSKAIR